MKHVLVISSSLRKGGNTDILADRFADGARSAGNSVEKVSLIGKDISFCNGCLACQRTGRCTISDDASAIVSKMKEADVIAFATPVYFYGMSGQLKALLDRSNPLYPFDYSFRDIYLLTAGSDTADGMESRTLSGLQGWADCFGKCSIKGTVCARGSTEAGDVLKDEAALDAALIMGKSV